MPAKQHGPQRELSLSWNQGLQLVAKVQPVDGFVDVIRLQVSTKRDRLVLRFDSREQVMLLLAAVLALLDGLDKAATSYEPHTKVFRLG